MVCIVEGDEQLLFSLAGVGCDLSEPPFAQAIND
jgi:hypothetical protein